MDDQSAALEQLERLKRVLLSAMATSFTSTLWKRLPIVQAINSLTQTSSSEAHWGEQGASRHATALASYGDGRLRGVARKHVGAPADFFVDVKASAVANLNRVGALFGGGWLMHIHAWPGMWRRASWGRTCNLF